MAWHRGARPTSLANVNGKLFFQADDGIHGSELWRSDGTSTGTVLVRDIVLGAGDSSPRQLTNVNGMLYFVLIPIRTEPNCGRATAQALARFSPATFFPVPIAPSLRCSRM